MQVLGLPGKAFIPMIIGFGCNVPAIMAARTLENQRDRILTVLMSPFMSCGARLSIFAVFVSAFFTHGGQNIVFALYLIGIAAATLTGFVLRHALLAGEPAPLLMELPAYHIPMFKNVCYQTWLRLKNFLFKAGKFIIPICILIGFLNALNTDGTLNLADSSAHSWLAEIGKWLTPLFSPMGIQLNNWPATVGLMTGVLAKEVVIATLNSLYTEVGHLVTLNSQNFHFWSQLYQAFASIPANLFSLTDALKNPVLASTKDPLLNQGVLGQMALRFDGAMGAFAYLIFVLLYIPCISTAAVIARELNKAWMFFSLIWNTLLAYGLAVIVYQSSLILRNPNHSLSSILWVVLTFTVIFLSIFAWARLNQNFAKWSRFGWHRRPKSI